MDSCIESEVDSSMEVSSNSETELAPSVHEFAIFNVS